MRSDVFFICGVSGCGKSTIGSALADQLNIEFRDGDEFHPEENITKMASGQPLNDQDRKGWLESINRFVALNEKPIVIGCSALKEDYRRILSQKIDRKIHWIFLMGSYELILERMKNREGHFMPESLLQSQFDIFEIPDYALKIDISDSKEEIVTTIIKQTQMKNQMGLIGLGVMGKSLSRNFANRGVQLSVYNRHVAGIEENVAKDFIQKYPELKDADGFDDLQEFVDSLASPRKIFLMISAGSAIDSTIDLLIPMLDKDDLIIDGGNSHYKRTQERNEKLKSHGLYFIGTGVSGGEEGALKGPSIMPGGEKEAYALIKNELESIAAKDKTGIPCCTHVGKGGAGHFVKMVHNGIEYAEMQFLAEIYGILNYGKKLSNEAIADVLESWLDTETTSYLLEITVKILRKKEGVNDLIDLILDKAGNKGTGSWTTIAACELGVPTPTLTAALFARYQSAFKAVRTKAQALYRPGTPSVEIKTDQLYIAYKAARIINHHQGLHLIKTASDQFDWEVDLTDVCRIWTNGCIIRSALMENLGKMLSESEELLLHTTVVQEIRSSLPALRQVVGNVSSAGISIPCFQASQAYIETFIRTQSTANIIQAQRDFFGAHRYQRKDDPGGPSHHTIWEE